MGQKDKDHTHENYKKLKDEIIIEKVDDIFRSQPDNYIAALEEMGFEYHEEDDEEEIQERNAKPKNKNQRHLVMYFEGTEGPTEMILATFLTERDAKQPNLPLIRRYFKKANKRLKELLINALDHYPRRIELLSDLVYFHEFENILTTLIAYYTRACMNQENMETFTELAQDFYYATTPDGYEALYALRELFEPQTEKRKIIDFMISQRENDKEENSVKQIDF
jgi:hypothetical protein